MIASIRQAETLAKTGHIRVTWEDGSSTLFRGVDEIRERLARDAARDRQFAENMLLHQLVASLDKGEAVATAAGTSVTLDRDSAEAVKVQKGETRDGV